MGASSTAIPKLVDRYGRALDELDTMRMMVHVPDFLRDQPGYTPGMAFTVVSADGHPICGRSTGQPPVIVTATAWRAEPDAGR